MAVTQYAQQMLANLPSAHGKTAWQFYETMLRRLPSFQRMEFIFKVIKKQGNSLPTLIWSNGKNDEKSQQFRFTGNECFRRMEFVEALKWYNKALAHAESTENLGLCYANRSAAYYELSMLTACLENIDAARRCIVSDRVKAKLQRRHMKAQNGVLTTTVKPQQQIIMKLCRPAKQSQPFYIDCLSKIGDEIITSEQLQPGDVISLEKPFSQMLSRSHIYDRCTYCLTNKKYLSMIPCPNCSSAMFCNALCYDMAMKIFHRFECSIIDGLFDFLHDSMYLGIRTVLIALHGCNGSMKEYCNMLMNCFNDESDPFEVNITLREQNVSEMIFLMIHNLKRSFNFSLQHHVAAVVVAEKLKSNFQSLFDCDRATAALFSASIFHMLQISQENNVLLEETAFSGDSVGNDITIYGCGLFPFASNFKLSCAPNVLLLNDNGTLTGLVLRKIGRDDPIEPGLMSRNHFLTDRKSRNERMWTFSGRWCHCEACEHDYDLYTELRPFRANDLLPLVPLIPEQECLNLVQIVSAVKSIGAYLDKAQYLPYVSREMGQSIQTMIRLLRQLAQPYDTDLIFTEYSKLTTNV